MRDPRPVRGARARRRARAVDDGLLGSASYLWTRSATIYAGTSEVQRNIIAQRVLGLTARRRARAPCRRTEIIERWHDRRHHRRVDAVLLATPPEKRTAAAENVFRNYGRLDWYHNGTDVAQMLADMDRNGVQIACISGETEHVREGRAPPSRPLHRRVPRRPDATSWRPCAGCKEHVEQVRLQGACASSRSCGASRRPIRATTRSTPSASSSTSPSRRRSATPGRSSRPRPAGRSTSTRWRSTSPSCASSAATSAGRGPRR